MPYIYQDECVDQILDINQAEPEQTMKRLVRDEGIFAGVSAGGFVAAASRFSVELDSAIIVAIICDRGDR